jgi:acetyl esterase/lipase
VSQEPGSTYTIDDEVSDVQRAIRLVKARAAEWHVRADHVGVIGFSAGGELALLSGTRDWRGNVHARDRIDREDARPAFMGLIYPGMSQTVSFGADTPRAFLLCGERDNPEIAQGLPNLYLSLRRANVSAELHIIAGAGHGFGVRSDNPPAVANWIVLFRDWLDTQGITRP